MSLVDIIKSAYLKSHHKILLPLVIHRANLSTGLDRVIQNSQNQNERKEKDTSPENKDQNPHLNGSKARASEASVRKIEGLSEDQKHYEILKQMIPRNSIEDLLNEQILTYLSLAYELE